LRSFHTKKSLLQVSDDILVGLGHVSMMRHYKNEVKVYNDEGGGEFYGGMYPAECIVMPSEFTPLLQDANNNLFHWAFRRSSISGVRFKGDTALVSVSGVPVELVPDLVTNGVVYAVVTDPLIRQQFQ